MTAGTAGPRGVSARTPVAPLPPSCPTRSVDLTARTSAPPEMPPSEVCSFQLPKTCSFQLPLTGAACGESVGSFRDGSGVLRTGAGQHEMNRNERVCGVPGRSSIAP